MIRLSRISDINIIPKRLVDQIDQRPFTVDEFYSVNERNIDSMYFEIILNSENEIIGFINYCIDDLCKEIYINILSIDKAYKCDNKTLLFIIDAFKLLSKRLSYKVVWHSYKPAYFVKKGFHPIKGTLLEYPCLL